MSNQDSRQGKRSILNDVESAGQHLSESTDRPDTSCESWGYGTNDPLADLGIISGAGLLSLEFRPLSFVVPEVLPEGTSVLVGPPKSGKSLLALDIALAIALGSRALHSAHVEDGAVLYIDLDGSQRGMRQRIEKMLPGYEVEGKMDKLESNFHCVGRNFPSANEGGLQAIRDFVLRYPNTKLIVIDTLQKFRGAVSGRKNMNAADV